MATGAIAGIINKKAGFVGPTTPSYSSGSSGGSDYSSGSGGGYSSGAATASAPAPVQSSNDWLAAGGDAAYQAQVAALQKALSDEQADTTNQTNQYNTDYGKSLQQLGWTPAAGSAPGAWNFTDDNTSSGRAYDNQLNDFASRGLLQSSLYGTANDNLVRSLNDQLSGLDTAKQNYMDNLNQQLTAYQNQNTASQQQAKADALARYAAQYGV